jgi:antibiotic biosynthesis monooxygenase (ABM) superfamily enzyme
VSVEIEHPRADGDVRHAGGGTEAMFPEHILTVRATVEPAHEEEFNRWYNQEHIPDVLKLIPGCLGAARYRVVDGDGSHQYMAVYRFTSEAALRSALQGSEIKELIRRYDQAIGAFSTRARTTYTRVFELEKSST